MPACWREPKVLINCFGSKFMTCMPKSFSIVCRIDYLIDHSGLVDWNKNIEEIQACCTCIWIAIDWILFSLFVLCNLSPIYLWISILKPLNKIRLIALAYGGQRVNSIQFALCLNSLADV